jgi:hypothetical protein
MHSERAGVKEQVTGLMKACHLAMSAGRPDRAAALAREAYALDPERVTADPLVCKLHLLTLQQDSGRGGGPCTSCPAASVHTPGARAAHPASCDSAARQRRASQRSASRAPVCPALPPVDAGVPAAFDEVLGEAEGQGPPSDMLPYPLCEEPGGADYPPGDCGTNSPGVSGSGLLEGFVDGLLPDLPAGSRLELGVTWGAVSLSCDVPVGGAVYHVLYNRGALAVWLTPDPSAGDKAAAGPR